MDDRTSIRISVFSLQRPSKSDIDTPAHVLLLLLLHAVQAADAIISGRQIPRYAQS